MRAMPTAAAVAAIQVRTGTGSFRNTLAQITVRSGLTLITTKVFAIVVREIANKNAANITAHIRPEMSPGRCARLTAAQGEALRISR